MGITNQKIDRWYNLAMKKGAFGGKILGAGGGGFLYIYAPEEKRQLITEALRELRLVEFSFEEEGSKIIYSG